MKLSEAPAAPDSFSAVAGDGQVWLGWRSPADFTISGYEYQQKEGTDAFGDWQTIPGSRTGSTFHIVTGLTNGTSYTFQVRAVNAAGEGDSSGEQSATPATASSAPVKPEGFAARQTGDGQVELTWEASSNPLNVTGYQFTHDNGSTWTDISGSNYGTVSHIITGLTQGVTYTFRVRAVNNAGSTESDSQPVTVVDKPSAPTGLSSTVGDTQVRLTWDDPGNASITKYQLWQFPPTSIRLTSDDRAELDELGWSVAVDGDTLVIGALGDEPRNTGAAYVFTRDARGWVQVGKLAAENRADPFAGNDAGFGHSVAVHGDTIVVGAYEENHPATTTNAGAAYVFTKPATGWADMNETARLTASDAVASDEFGASVAVHGDTIVVGAREQTIPANGAAYIFTKPANGWADGTETAKLAGESNGDRFGRSVAVHGDTVVVGAHEEGDYDRGEAYVFTKSAATGVWDDWDNKNGSNATARLTASDRADRDKFGWSVAFDGETIVVGAPFDDDDGDSSGSAYVFIKPASGSWVSTSTAAKLTASDGAENDQFGFSVAVDGNTVVVGADQDDSKRGSAYVFTKPPTGWTDAAGTDKRTIYDRRGDDRFGNSVAVDGDTVLVGAVGDDSVKGSAYVFGTEWSDIPGSGAGTTSHIATRLPNGAEHTFRVRAVNAAGEGVVSEMAEKPMAANSRPSVPADFTATQTGVGKVLLEWAASRDPQTGLNPLTVSRYSFELGKNDSRTWADIHGSDSSTVSHTVTSLTTGDTYTFDLRAVNGSGQNAAGSQSVTLVAQLAAPDSISAVAGDEQVKLRWDPGAISKYQLLQIDPSKLFASDGAAYDEFGISIAVDGDIAVVGARQDDTRNGSAYVFTKVSGVWSQVAQLTASDGAADDEFGYSVAVDSDTIVVGAHLDDGTDSGGNAITDSGSAYVFTKPALGWGDWSNLDTNGKAGLTTKLTAFGAAAGDEFGISVAVDGDTILVGAHQNDSNKGAAYIFTRFRGVWGNAPVSGNHRVETAKLVAADAAADDEFGISVALDGDTAVIGALKDDDNGNQSGSAYVFTKVSGVWSQKAKLIASDGAANDEFGISVALDGDTAVIGARKDDDNGNQSGSAYVFTKVSGVWSQKAKLTAADGAANDEFGISVAVEGDTVIVGANLTNHIDSDGNAVNDSGSAYVFTRDSAGGWSQKAKLTASDAAAEDLYGYSVAVSGDTVVVGAPYNDYDDTDGDTNDDEGAAYFLSVLEWAGIVDILDSDDGTRSHIVTGLTNDVEHTFQVRGVNAAGGGLASAGAGGTPTFAIPDPPNGLTADAGDAVVDLTWDDPEDSTIEKYQLLEIIQGGKLSTASTDDPVVRGDGFGISVAVDGNTAVIGAYKDDDAGADSGSAHVFTRSSPADPWSWAAKLTASDAAANDEFGIAVAVDGDTIVVGAHQNDSSKGAAYVFTWNSSNSKWEQKAKLTASDAAANDEFGIAVAVDGDTIVVGAHQNDSNKGAAYVFIKPGSGGWIDATETAKLTASDAAANDNFGISVAVDGGTVVVGAHKADYIDLNDSSNNLADSGAAYVFTKPGSGGWVNANETAKLTASDAAANDEFGISVAVHGETVVVGAHQSDADDQDNNEGAAYVFTKPETDANDDESKDWKDWASLGDEGKAGLTAKLIASDAARGDEFGISVAVADDDDTIVVGAYLDDDNGDNSGSAYVFTRDSNGWSQKTKLTGPSRGKGDWLGHSVAVVGNTVIAGAERSNISGPDSGAVYLWTVPGWTDIANSDATTTFLTVTGLTNLVEYSFQVRAVDAVDKVEGAGAGPPSEVRATPLKPRPAKPTGLSAAPGDTQVRLSWDLPGESSPPINSYQLWQHAENAILTADTREANDEFGYAVAIDGDTAVVGMPGEDNPDNSGAAFVYTRDSFGTWSQVARLRASDPVDNVDGDGDDDNDEHRFGLSVAVHEDTSNGDTIVVGAPDHSDSKGAVYVFSEPSNGWANDTDSDDPDTDVDHITETAKFLASDGAAEDEFGNSVAVDGDTIVVGAHQDDDNGESSGSTYVFTKGADDDWANDQNKDHTTQTLKLSGSGSSDNFGRSVAIDGDTIVVGASGDDSDKGSAFVFIKPANGWANSPGTEVAKLTAYSGKVKDRFGRSVAIDGDTIVVGAHQPTYQDGSETIKRPGATYVFIEPDTGWTNSPGTETAKLTASDGDGGDQFGFSVAMDGDTVVIGADALNETNSSGSAYVFTKPAAGWVDSTEAAKLTGSGTANGDRFGLSVSVDGLTVMVGANGQGANNEGAAYVYGIQDWSPITGSTGETRSHFATGLTNDAEHTFAVRAVNDGGASGPSNQASAEPGAEASAPAKPRYFSAVQVGAGEVRLEWEPSADPLAVVRFDYTADGGSNWPRAVGSHSTTASYTVSDLTVGTTYTFAVRAVNSAGEGVSSDPWSVTIAVAPADRPTALTAVAGDEQVELSWRYSGGQTSTTGFQYQQKTEGDFGDDWTDVTGSTWTTRSHIVTGLTNDIPYTFRVRAVNVTVGSEPSNTVTSTPEAARSRPARPTNFNAEQNGVGQVELTWDTASARLSVTGYQYTANGGSDWNNISGSDSGTVSHTVTGLMVGTRYRFAVRAVNSGMLSDFSFRDVTIIDVPNMPTGLGTTSGDTQATFHWNVTVETIDEHQLLQLPQSKLTADDRAVNDEFGYSVAVDGNTAVVGAPGSNGNAGAAYVFVFTEADDDGVWSQAAKLTAPSPVTNDEFGISVAVDGSTVVVGAPGTNSNTGEAYVFTEPSQGWGAWDNLPQTDDAEEDKDGLTAKLTALAPATNDEFGISVAVDGGTVVVGAHKADYIDLNDSSNNLADSGAAYVFTKPGSGGWVNATETAKLTASDAAANDEFGISVAVHGETVVVGAHQNDADDQDNNEGAAYVFTKPGSGGWADATEGAKFTAPDGAAKDQFGISVAIDGNTVVVGAHQPTYQENDKDVDVGPGAAYVVTRDSNSGKWGQPVKLTASNGHAGDGFGNSVAVDGSTAVVGAYLDDRDNAARSTGSTYVFARKSGRWSQTLNLAGPLPDQNDRLGYSVAVDGGTLLAGAPQDDKDPATEKDPPGFAYAMDISNAEWTDFVSTELTDNGEDYFYRVLKLTNDQEYAFRVRSVNAAANRPSNETVAATPMSAKPGRTEGLSAKAGSRRVTLSWDDPLDSSITGYQYQNPPEQSKLTAGADGESGGRFGESVAVNGGTAVLGAPEHDGTDSGGNAITDAGAAYVFTRDPDSGEWSEPIELTAGSDSAANDWFGYSVAVDGDTIVVGAYQHDLTDDDNNILADAGAAYVFTKDPLTGVWSEPVKLIASDGVANDWFGHSVAVDGDTIVVGARGDDGKKGAAYVFTKVGGVWGNDPDPGETHRVETAKLTASDGEAVDYFGHSVAVDRNTIVVGAHLHDAGAAYVFTRDSNSGEWGQTPVSGTHRIETVKLTAADAVDGDQFGHSVAVDGNTVVIGARKNNAAYVFILGSDTWSQAARLEASDGDGSEDFGSSVTVRGSTIVVGADYANIDECEEVDKDGDCQDEYRSGAAYLFTKPDGAVWANDVNEDHRTESGKLILPTGEGAVEKSDEFGNSVALDGQIIVVGAPEANDGFGSVYVSDIPQWGFLASGAETTSATVGGLTNGVEYAFQVRAIDSYGEGLPSNIARATPMPVVTNRPPYFIIGSDTVTFTVDENTPPGSLVRDAVTAKDPDGDILTYSLSGTDAASFVLDGSTGEITVGSGTLLDYESGPTRYTVVVSVHDGRDAYGDNDSTIDDLIEVSIDVSNVDEAGTVSVSLEQPEVGTPVVVSLSDLDGSLSDISWQWARSSDRTDWSDITGANSDSYTPVADDVGIYLQATASYTDGHGPGKSAHVVMERQTAQPAAPNRAPYFIIGSDSVTFTVDENTPPGSLVGDAVTATDPDGDVLTYSLSGIDASSFVLDGSTGQITVGSGTLLDYESGHTRYTVVVSVHDGGDAYGNDGTAVDASIEVSIDVSNVDEAGTVSVSLEQPEVGTPVVVSLSDLDGSLSDISWQWARSSDRTDWSDITGANSDSYTPVADDVGIYLQATASYTDGHGPGKSAHAVMERQTAQRGPSFNPGGHGPGQTAQPAAPNRAPYFIIGSDSVTFTVDENTPPGSLVGDAVTAKDPDGDVLTYSLSGTDAASFVLDGSTGQITVGSGTLLDYESGPTRYTVVVSVHDGRSAYGNDDTTIDDLIEVSIDVSNVDEAGTVSVSLEQLEVGTAVAASLSDLDGSVSDISWQWARSSDRSDWSDISGANSDSYTPVADDVGIYLQATASYTDGHGPGKSAHTVMERQTAQRGPSFEGDVTFTVDENTPPGSLVGDAITATDPDGDVLTYSLSGIDASSFVLDGSTGQITVGSGTLLDYESGPTRYTVVVSVHDGRGAYGDDDTTIDDLIEVSIDVSNVDEAGTVSVSLEQLEVGTALAASLSDPDGSLSNISWQWARSSDRTDWSDITGANSDSYTPVADDVGIYLQATASYTDGHGPGKSAHAVMERQTAQRGPSFEGDVTFTVDENTPPGSLVGDAITATDPDGDVLTYSLSGTDASSFVLDGSTGQITVGSGTLLDYESGPTRYTVVVSVHDGRGAYGNDDTTIDDLIEVSIDVSNVDEAGTVSVSLEQPEVGTPVVASLSDPDGSLSDISWQWARSSDRTDWSDISGANSDSYTPVADDVGIYLQATASYTDGHGPGKSAHTVMERQTAQRGPSFEGDVTFTVDENTPPGSLVGDAITATDPDGDVLTYSLSGIDASSFVLDGSTGQITVGSGTLLDYESGPTRYTVVVSVHDGRGAYGDDDTTIDDLIEVSIDVSNVDEAGTVSVSLEQLEVGTALAASLSDPDGSLSNISWQWARSSDRTDWSDITGANSDSYTPVADDVGIYLQATASYTDGHGPGKSAHAVMERQTAQRGPSFEGDVTFTVDENTPPGSLVGDAITATDPDGDVLTYSLSGTDASSFVLDGSTGQITVGSGTLLDYESGPTRYTVVVSVHDGRGAYGNDDTTIDDLIEVSIDVSNVDEAGTVSVSLEQPEVGTAVAASLSDPDGSLSNISWQWARSSDRTDWQDMAGASSFTYTPVDLDADKYLRVTASYADGEGSGKQAQAVLNNPVQGLPEPVATPTTTATDTPAPEPNPTPTLTAPTPTAEPAPSEADGGDEGFPWWVIVAVVIGVVAGVVLIIVVLRSRR